VNRPEYSVRLLRVAEDDLTEIVTYIAADRPLAADKFASRIERSLSRLAQNPHLGRIPDEEGLLRLGYRYLVVENHLIFYAIEGDTIYVHRILHGARDYLSLF
jgi:plasmid stabilization system protein ParE